MSFMLTERQLKFLSQIRRANDGCAVKIYDGNLQHGIRRLKKQVELSGVFKQLKIRRWHMTSKARRRAKRVKSLQRARHQNKLMARLHK
jgi:ribosomal protein S21